VDRKSRAKEGGKFGGGSFGGETRINKDG